jgi:hypothetical protein
MHMYGSKIYCAEHWQAQGKCLRKHDYVAE